MVLFLRPVEWHERDLVLFRRPVEWHSTPEVLPTLDMHGRHGNVQFLRLPLEGLPKDYLTT